MKDCAGKLQLPPQFCRICQVAIVRHRHLPVDMAHNERLCIFAADRPRRGIPCMSHSNLPVPKRRQVFFGEHIPHQAEILVHADHAVPVDGDPAALLPPVLQGKQSIVGICGDIRGARRVIDAKYAAFLMDFPLHICFLSADFFVHSPSRRRITS